MDLHQTQNTTLLFEGSCQEKSVLGRFQEKKGGDDRASLAYRRDITHELVQDIVGVLLYS